MINPILKKQIKLFCITKSNSKLFEIIREVETIKGGYNPIICNCKKRYSSTTANL
jgi:hypothetical protein